MNYVVLKGKKFKVKEGRLNLSQQNIENINEVQGLENLKSLEWLKLEKNQITEIQDSKFPPNLKWLGLSNNYISIIKGIGNLTKLETIHLRNNEITEINGLESFNLKKSLKYLFLNENQITEIKGLENLENLLELHLNGNQIAEMKNLGHLTQLQSLNLRDNQIREVNDLEDLTQLKELFLDENQKITRINGLESLINLKRLEISHCEITEIKGLESLYNLTRLDLSRNPITEIKGLETLNDLVDLYLDGTKIKQSVLRSLGGLSKGGKANDPQKFVKYCREAKTTKKKKIEDKPDREVIKESDTKQIQLPFKAYRGSEPFVFSSYAHRDKQHVYPIIGSLNKDGINIWYDEGIPVSENWKKVIAENLERCTAFLVFITNNIKDSEYVKKEISFALKKKKPFIGVYLSETKLPTELEFEIADIQALNKHLMPEPEFYNKLRETLYGKLNE